MKNNRRNRKLNFIRHKNKVRRGNEVTYFIKVSHELLQDMGALEIILSEEFTLCEKNASKFYKLILKISGIRLTLVGDDFAKDQYTVAINLKYKP